MTEKEIPECYRWANDLKVGDTVFVASRNHLSKSKVTKLTATQIVVGDHDNRYQRRTLSRRIDTWTSDDIQQVTPELEAVYVRSQTIKQIFSLAHDVYYSAVTRSRVEKFTSEQLIELQHKLHDIVVYCEEFRPIKVPTED